MSDVKNDSYINDKHIVDQLALAVTLLVPNQYLPQVMARLRRLGSLEDAIVSSREKAPLPYRFGIGGNPLAEHPFAQLHLTFIRATGRTFLADPTTVATLSPQLLLIVIKALGTSSLTEKATAIFTTIGKALGEVVTLGVDAVQQAMKTGTPEALLMKLGVDASERFNFEDAWSLYFTTGTHPVLSTPQAGALETASVANQIRDAAASYAGSAALQFATQAVSPALSTAVASIRAGLSQSQAARLLPFAK